MANPPAASKRLILDANVLIDFAGSELGILTLAARHLGPVCVTRPLLREVEQLDQTTCEKIGIIVIETTLDQLLEAASGRGPLSFEDRLCLAVARDEGAFCVTNDRRLRSECARCGVEVRWGLELMLELVEHGHLSARRAVRVARTIHEENPFHITTAIVARFEARIREITRSPPG